MRAGKLLAGTTIVAFLGLATVVAMAVVGFNLLLSRCTVDQKEVDQARRQLGVSAEAFANEAAVTPGPAARSDEALAQIAGRHESKLREVARSPDSVMVVISVTAAYRIPGAMPGTVEGCRRVFFLLQTNGQWAHEISKVDQCPG